MAYSPTTRIGNKSSDHSALGHPNLLYGYDNSGLTHQPRVIYDANSTQCVQLYWDRNGNLRQIQSDKDDARFHMWDDDNQLLMSLGPTTCGYYGNASDGKRVYKTAGTFSISNINGGAVSGEAVFDNTTLYPNPYMTLTHDGYTKHYFMGSERVGATFGGGNNGNWLVCPIDNLTQREANLLSDLENSSLYKLAYYDCYDYPHLNSHTSNTDVTGTIEYGDAEYPDYQYDDSEQYYGNIWLYFKGPLAENITDYYHRDAADEPYYYHSDHLGSAAWITDHHGEPVQYLMYAPYGEELLNQQTNLYSERFTFTGKERDQETGYDYHNARYREPNFFNYFISVDPMGDIFISQSPYVYGNANPIKYTDPTGLYGYKNDEGDYQWFPDATAESFVDEAGKTWTYVAKNEHDFNEAVTIREAIVAGLTSFGYKLEDVKKDVGLYDESSPLFTKEAKLKEGSNYHSNWKEEYSTGNDESDKFRAYQSPEIGESNLALKYYEKKEKEYNAIGIVRAGIISHLIEACIEMVERSLFHDQATNDPMYDMHYNNAQSLKKYLQSGK